MHCSDLQLPGSSDATIRCDTWYRSHHAAALAEDEVNPEAVDGVDENQEVLWLQTARSAGIVSAFWLPPCIALTMHGAKLLPEHSHPPDTACCRRKRTRSVKAPMKTQMMMQMVEGSQPLCTAALKSRASSGGAGPLYAKPLIDTVEMAQLLIRATPVWACRAPFAAATHARSSAFL